MSKGGAVSKRKKDIGCDVLDYKAPLEKRSADPFDISRLNQINYQDVGEYLDKISELNKKIVGSGYGYRSARKTCTHIYLSPIHMSYAIIKFDRMFKKAPIDVVGVSILTVLFTHDKILQTDLFLLIDHHSESSLKSYISKLKKLDLIYVIKRSGNKVPFLGLTERGLKFVIKYVFLEMVRNKYRYGYKVRLGRLKLHRELITEFRKFIS